MEAKGIHARVINMCTIKPLDEELVLQAAQECGKIITVRGALRHRRSGRGGLRPASARSAPCPCARIGVNDEFGHSGPAADLLKQFGLSAEHITEVTEAFVK